MALVALLAPRFHYPARLTAVDADARNEFRVAALPPALPHFVGNVVGVGASEEMGGVDTDPIVAMVKHMKVPVEVSVGEFVDDSVWLRVFAFEPELTVISMLAASRLAQPEPALMRTFPVYLRPESPDIGFFHAEIIA